MKPLFALTFALAVVVAPTALYAQSQATDLTAISLEDLMEIRITSASRKEQRVGDVAAAVYVISRDDIRRSGLRTLPELLRLAPGVQVARVDATKWAISVRGFNNLYSNKLLVLIDGRTVYNRVFSGVFWGSEDLLADDIERIEIVRGPGGAVWGANAVNGVINVVTRTAKETAGKFVSVIGGTGGHVQGAARYGGSIRGVDYRLTSQWSGYGDSPLANDLPAADAATTLSNSVRADWKRGRDAITIAGGLFTNESDGRWVSASTARLFAASAAEARTDRRARSADANAVIEWTRTNSDSEFHVQSFVTRRDVDDLPADLREVSSDLDVQYYTKAGAAHDLVFGGGIRRDVYETTGSFVLTMNGVHSRRRVFSLFAQDEVTLSRRVKVTVGSRFEHETQSGWSVQPTARLMWEVVPRRQHLWAATSRAVRTPSAVDLDLRYVIDVIQIPGQLPILLGAVGNPQLEPERFTDAEVGYRLLFGARAGLDVTVFRGRYEALQTAEPMAPVFVASPAPGHIFAAARLANLLDADSSGVEVAGYWSPSRRWRLEGSYSGLSLTPRPRPESLDPAPPSDGDAPRHQWQVRSSVRATDRLELGGALFYQGRLERRQVPAFTRADARAELKLNRGFTLVATGRNLLERAHREFDGIEGVIYTAVPRSFSMQIVWRH